MELEGVVGGVEVAVVELDSVELAEGLFVDVAEGGLGKPSSRVLPVVKD